MRCFSGCSPEQSTQWRFHFEKLLVERIAITCRATHELQIRLESSQQVIGATILELLVVLPEARRVVWMVNVPYISEIAEHPIRLVFDENVCWLHIVMAVAVFVKALDGVEETLKYRPVARVHVLMSQRFFVAGQSLRFIYKVAAFEQRSDQVPFSGGRGWIDCLEVRIHGQEAVERSVVPIVTVVLQTAASKPQGSGNFGGPLFACIAWRAITERTPAWCECLDNRAIVRIDLALPASAQYLPILAVGYEVVFDACIFVCASRKRSVYFLVEIC